MSKARPQVRIRNSAELFESLRHPEAAIRVPALAAVAAQPQRVLAYGCHEGRDVVDELIRQLEGDAGLYAPAVLGALVVFADERVVAACSKVLQSTEDHRMLQLACRRLAQEPDAAARDQLRRLLFSSHPTQATAAADSLRERNDLTLAEKIHLALWVAYEAPEMAEESARPLWLGLLDGPLQTKARRCLEEQGKAAFDWLVETRPLDRWLLQWGCQQFPEQAEPLLERALDTEQAVFVLEQLAAHPDLFPRLRQAAAAFLSDPNGERRCAAWQVAPLPENLDWLTRWTEEGDSQVRLALGQRMAAECRQERPLLLLAESSDWRIRSLATQGLVRLQARSSARELALGLQAEVRAVGTSVLLALEDYEWMEEHLLT